MSINIQKHIDKIKRQNKEESLFIKNRSRFPTDESKLFQYKLKLMSEFSNQLAPKIYSFDVVKSWLYEQGFYHDEARSLIWCAAGKGVIHIDANFNIKCIKHKL